MKILYVKQSSAQDCYDRPWTVISEEREDHGRNGPANFMRMPYKCAGVPPDWTKQLRSKLFGKIMSAITLGSYKMGVVSFCFFLLLA